MANSYKDALTQLEKAQEAMNAQDISHVPAAQLVNFERSKAAVYGEIQALQARQISARDEDYAAITTEFRDCKSELTDLSNWVFAREARDRNLLTMLTKGVSIALSILI
ncbi:hypothetical protein [Sneathiella litorea]|uniref:Uncharacterized protein n=1 Tax=Sneathiella litorea TaxID=2606216 RepID=A0A6L8W308_9PROT|nr:hypothetical protein [Sneathiella litorea]MZR29485.1 hypothetical protein [Sneathiella litorea]